MSEDFFLQSRSRSYPFTAIVGQDEMKRALLLTAVDPSIGGVLIMGHRGTAKSTAVRALAALLPPIPDEPLTITLTLPDGVVEKSVRFSGDGAPAGWRPVPFVDLPLSATEDRVVGALDIEAALARGQKAFEPGLLARAHGGFLYIDEVNLLEDHLVDLLLDVAASGVNVVEREGLSVRHPARFVLVGSGNPEEGDLRPQLLDRFGFYVHIETITDVKQRMEVVNRSEAFRRDPEGFTRKWAKEEAQLRQRIQNARQLLPEVEIPDSLLQRMVELCLRLKVDGHRGEITLSRAARAMAAFEGRKRVTSRDIRRVAVMSLQHRLRKDPLDEMESGEKIRQAMKGLFVGSSA
ncbi:MAG: magnesium chelatase ATPase subunit I [Calditrichaeota bacterium]|nr:magnesium chelatase ATPase subunit I [Calditrichota bacterium]